VTNCKSLSNELTIVGIFLSQFFTAVSLFKFSRFSFKLGFKAYTEDALEKKNTRVLAGWFSSPRPIKGESHEEFAPIMFQVAIRASLLFGFLEFTLSNFLEQILA